MESTFAEVHYDVEKAIDAAFRGKFILNFRSYLSVKKALRRDVTSFIKSVTSQNIREVVSDLDIYLEGGNDELHKQLREAYGHLSKPQARKIRNYLAGILEDAKNYAWDKRPGRRPAKTK